MFLRLEAEGQNTIIIISYADGIDTITNVGNAVVGSINTSTPLSADSIHDYATTLDVLGVKPT